MIHAINRSADVHGARDTERVSARVALSFAAIRIANRLRIDSHRHEPAELTAWVSEMFFVIVRGFALACRGHRELVVENLALRQQLIALKRSSRQLRVQARDRLSWIALAATWRRWRAALVLVQPETVVRWQRVASPTMDETITVRRPSSNDCSQDPGTRPRHGSVESFVGRAAHPR